MSTRPRVLLADDHPGVATALSRVLSFDCDVIGIVSDGNQVVAAAARAQPVVVVVDVNLPNINGLEVCREIVQTLERASVIVMSAMDDEAVTKAAVAAGASAFVHKIAAARELVGAINRAWAERAGIGDRVS
jgi:DNA-binding NarL/FixJ family response regulator